MMVYVYQSFQHDHSAYFYISLCSTTQPALFFLSAGVTAEEIAKDEKHQAAVEKVESNFITGLGMNSEIVLLIE